MMDSAHWPCASGRARSRPSEDHTLKLILSDLKGVEREESLTLRTQDFTGEELVLKIREFVEKVNPPAHCGKASKWTQDDSISLSQDRYDWPNADNELKLAEARLIQESYFTVINSLKHQTARLNDLLNQQRNRVRQFFEQNQQLVQQNLLLKDQVRSLTDFVRQCNDDGDRSLQPSSHSCKRSRLVSPRSNRLSDIQLVSPAIDLLEREERQMPHCRDNPANHYCSPPPPAKSMRYEAASCSPKKDTFSFKAENRSSRNYPSQSSMTVFKDMAVQSCLETTHKATATYFLLSSENACQTDKLHRQYQSSQHHLESKPCITNCVNPEEGKRRKNRMSQVLNLIVYGSLKKQRKAGTVYVVQIEARTQRRLGFEAVNYNNFSCDFQIPRTLLSENQKIVLKLVECLLKSAGANLAACQAHQLREVRRLAGLLAQKLQVAKQQHTNKQLFQLTRLSSELAQSLRQKLQRKKKPVLS